jgi:quercetin dioxygenase-like cupin family protein
MAREIEIDSNKAPWTPTQWPGISRKALRRDEQTGARAGLLKFEPNSHLPRHMHPAGEEVFVLEGRVRFEDSWYEAGYYLYSPPGSMDDVYSDTGGVLFVTLPKPHVDM